MDRFRRGLRSTLLAAAIVAIAQQGQAQPAPGGSPQSDGNLAQNVFSQPDREVLQRLTNARKLLDEARYGEAVRLLGELLRDGGQTDGEGGSEDYFFQPDRSVPIHRSLKAEAQQMIGRMPSGGRELYELQYGSRARQLLDAAIADGDRGGLGKVSRCFFHTQAGYEATLLLGLDHLDHARPLAGALTLGRLRQSMPGFERFEPNLSLAAATCWVQAGGVEQAREVLLELKRRLGDRKVTVSGVSTKLFEQDADADAWLAGLTGPQGPVTALEPDRWVMFRGSASRNAATRGSAPLLNLRWQIPATDDPSVESILRQSHQVRLEHANPTIPSLHPLAVHKEIVIERPGRAPWRIDDVVLMRTVHSLVAVDFATGKRFWNVPVDDSPKATTTRATPVPGRSATAQLDSALASRVWDDATYGTLSSDGKYVFAIEGLEMAVTGSSSRQVIVNGVVQRSSSKANNRLVAVDIRTGKLAWNLGGPVDEYALPMAGAFFLGPPLPLMGQLYVLAEINEEIRLLALDANRRGAVLWSQQLAAVEHNIVMDPLRRMAGASPSYSDGILVCPTSTGAVVAVDLATRSLLWGFRYERPQSVNRYAAVPFRVGRYPGTHAIQRWADASATVVGGRVLVTPIESQELHCLDLVDGRRRWK